MPLPAPKSPRQASKPGDLSPSELLDRTMELDIRGLLDSVESEEKQTDASSNGDDPTVVLDLTATQVHDLLTKKGK